jgi:hypothetical protein
MMHLLELQHYWKTSRMLSTPKRMIIGEWHKEELGDLIRWKCLEKGR